jgi:hypothetical protein
MIPSLQGMWKNLMAELSPFHLEFPDSIPLLN